MHLKFRNVNSAFTGLVRGMTDGTIPTQVADSRNGPVLKVTEPLTITYERPAEMVLFNRQRDASPFLHMYEALWMLAGRNDVAPLAYYAKRMTEFSDDGLTLNGAYGYRWRHADQWVCETYSSYRISNGLSEPKLRDVDQLEVIIKHLLAFPNSRRAVLQMWNVDDDLLKVGVPTYCYGPHTGPNCPHCIDDRKSLDVACNLCVLFAREDNRLGMTVYNRSNDLIWGLTGSNVVHFAMLQRYMADRLGLDVGPYHHVTNDCHVYTSRKDWKPKLLLADPEPDHYHDVRPGVYTQSAQPFPLYAGDPGWDKACEAFVDNNGVGDMVGSDTRYGISFFDRVAQPMAHAWHMHKARDYEVALYWVDRVMATDWRKAAHNWITKRQRQYEGNDPTHAQEAQA